MKKVFTLLLLLCVCAIASYAQTTENNEDKPVMTIGCLSDLHNELGLISGELSTVKLRGTFGNTIKRMHEEEDVDLICLGGDYTSDVTVSKENWERVKQLMRETSRSAFRDGRTQRPVIYVTGNHDYEVANFDKIPKGFNAGYYQDIMEEDIGPLTAHNAYYEEADNGSLGKQKLLGAYHYQIKGFDFVMLNCGLYFFKSAWDYTYSLGSVQWVADKLAELYASDPNKTVFFLLHVPFSDSNSISAANKGMKNVESTRLLKATLAKYPNLVMIYGHDHGTDSAFIRKRTSQRVTRYDVGGMVISSFDDTHVDDPVLPPDTPEEPTSVTMSIKSVATGKYLTYGSSTNLAVQDEAMDATIDKVANSDNHFSVKLGGNYVYCGSTATFSGNAKVTDYSKAFIYKVDDNKATRITATNELADGAKVVLVYKASKDKKYYALLPENTKTSLSSDNRMKAQLVAASDPGDEISVEGDNIVWQLNQREVEETGLPIDACIQNTATGKYIGEDSSNLNTVDEALTCNIYEENGKVYVKMPNNNRHLHIGSGGRFSRGDATALKFFEVVAPTVEHGSYVGTLVKYPKTGVPYAIAAEKSGKTYLLTNKVYKAGEGDNQRLEGQEVTVNDNTVSFADDNLIWTLKEREPGDPSFFSSFMGSMRYYNNSIEGDVSVSNSKIVQALMVYIYPDRITLKMKNYGESGTFGNITINKDLAAYTVYREVRNANGALTAIKGVTTENKMGKADGRVYDLTGRQVTRPTRGVYVMNGRKVVL